MVARDAHVDGKTAVGMETEHRARQAIRRLRDLTLCARRRAGRGGAGVRQVRFDLTPHPFHLLGHGVCPLLLSRGGSPVGFVGQHGKRRLEAVREVARPRDGSPHRLFAVLEQHVEIVDERLHFSGVDAVDAAFTTGMHGGQPRSQPVDGRQPAPHLDEPDDQADERENRDAWHVQEEVVKHSRRARVSVNDLRHDHAEHSKEPGRPEHGSEHDARAER